ncbi:Teichoic acid translocation permease TagG [Mesobacillus campisalis]|uniref:Transport permease protein n=1 Tax=Mesobacillus campisalis TaxID=1408103 RepID=A0A0M2SW30_9BACI|nr:ABC transporter permease [Mesobacillus campisalis]KKK38784.1 Teichoic acid translocation permease TagG [Mesobacillus campisalis]
MKAILEILREQVLNFHLIFRLASYDIKGKYQSHYLGAAWQFLSPALQILVYWFVFGMGIRGGNPIDGVPFIIWLLIGLIPWFFISPSIIQGSNSVYTKVSMVAKMKFPVSVLPSIVILSNAINFLIMLTFLGVILIIYGVNPGLYILQLPYYLISLFLFLFSVTLLFSTIATIIRDFQIVLQSLMRMMLYVTPVLWDMGNLPSFLLNLLKLNPLYYLIEGFRNTFLARQWFFEDWIYMLYFWVTVLLILFLGTFLHIRFRKKFVDYL